MNCDKKDLLLYAVTDRHWLNGRSLRQVVEESLDGGVTMVQLREKQLEEGTFLEEAKELQALCRQRRIPFLVNDNVDIALAMNADGVHVGQSDMEALDVRKKLGPDKIIGVSAQTVEQGVTARIQQRAARPGENGTRPGGAVTTKFDISNTTRRQREELERRARRGEKIVL